jgi:glycosyltransferase involved in cell wall biosynthesis
MKILQLCKKVPFPIKDGEAIAISYLSKALCAQGCELTLLAMNTTKHKVDVSCLPPEFAHYKAYHTIEVDNAIKPVEAFKNLFTGNSYHIERFISATFEQKLAELLQKNNFDIVQIETIYLAQYIPLIRARSNAKIVMRSHNVEHEIWERVAKNTASGLKKLYLREQSKRLKQFEVGTLHDYDLLVAISKRDLDMFAQLGHKGKSIVVPIGLDTQKYTPIYTLPTPFSLSFIGSLDWAPNIQGIEWFIDHVMPKVSNINQPISLHVAGRNTPKRLFQSESQIVHIHGEVPSSPDFLSQHHVMVVPLFSGSGMRAKIIEGMALGKTVITTTLGLEGINATPNTQVLIANTADEFLHQIQFCAENPLKIETIGRNARSFIEQHFDHQQIAQHLLQVYQNLLNQ